MQMVQNMAMFVAVLRALAAEGRWGGIAEGSARDAASCKACATFALVTEQTMQTGLHSMRGAGDAACISVQGRRYRLLKPMVHDIHSAATLTVQHEEQRQVGITVDVEGVEPAGRKIFQRSWSVKR